MKDEIKEILDIERYRNKDGYIENISLTPDEIHKIKDCITNLQEQLHQASLDIQELTEKDIDCPSWCDKLTNLQEELEDLRESNWAWHQTLKAQNKREYRSKFLKEFQKEYNTNTFPDYDEIYKRYDKIKKENERLKEEIEILTSDDDNDSVWLEDYNM